MYLGLVVGVLIGWFVLVVLTITGYRRSAFGAFVMLGGVGLWTAPECLLAVDKPGDEHDSGGNANDGEENPIEHLRHVGVPPLTASAIYGYYRPKLQAHVHVWFTRTDRRANEFEM